MVRRVDLSLRRRVRRIRSLRPATVTPPARTDGPATARLVRHAVPPAVQAADRPFTVNLAPVPSTEAQIVTALRRRAPSRVASTRSSAPRLFRCSRTSAPRLVHSPHHTPRLLPAGTATSHRAPEAVCPDPTWIAAAIYGSGGDRRAARSSRTNMARPLLDSVQSGSCQPISPSRAAGVFGCARLLLRKMALYAPSLSSPDVPAAIPVGIAAGVFRLSAMRLDALSGL